MFFRRRQRGSRVLRARRLACVVKGLEGRAQCLRRGRPDGQVDIGVWLLLRAAARERSSASGSKVDEYHGQACIAQAEPL